MPTEWFKNDGSGISVHAEDENLILVGNGVPHWVRVPNESPIRPGEKARVIASFNGACPKCRTPQVERMVRHLDLDQGLYVAECKPGCGFVFYHKAQVSKAEQTKTEEHLGSTDADDDWEAEFDLAVDRHRETCIDPNCGMCSWSKK